MKLIKLIFSFLAVLGHSFFISCQKESITIKDAQDDLSVNLKAKIPGDVSGTLPAAKVFFNQSTQTYQSGYAGGLDFGSEFTHPINKYSFPDYSPWMPSIGGVTGLSSFISYTGDGNRFVVVLGTVPGGFTYKYNPKDYLDSLSSGHLPDVSGFIEKSGGGSGGSGSNEDFYIVLSGQYVIDYTSPTGVSIVDVKTKLPNPTANLYPLLVLDQVVKDGNYYDVSIYESLNKVHQIKAGALTDNHPKQVFAFEAGYTVVNSNSIHLTGKITTNDGASFTFEETLSLALNP